jgi:molecular chaperone DnaK
MGLSSLWGKLSPDPEVALARARQKLDEALPLTAASFPLGEQAWACYQKALVAAIRCGGDAVTTLVLEFDPRFPPGRAPMVERNGHDPYLIGTVVHVPSLETRSLHKALTILLANKPVPDQKLEAADRLAVRLGDIDQIRRVEHLICLSLASRGESDRLISRLLGRRKCGLLARPEIEEVVSAYLSAHRFHIASSWVGFFEQLRQDELPRIHEVHEVLGRFRDEADAALRSLLECAGTEAALRAVEVSEGQVHNPNLAIKAHHHAGEAFYQEGDYLTAAEHFLKAKDPSRASDCYLLAGRIPDAIRWRQVSPAWLAAVREWADHLLNEFVQQGAWLEAIQLVRGTAWSLRGKDIIAKDNEEYIRSEAARLEGILDSLVRTARASLIEESRNAEPGAEVFRRWSAIEEAAGNFLEAGLQAESGQDHVTAVLMFEQAGAFEQARRAFDRSPRSDLERRAERLEREGDFHRAGRLYGRLGQTEKVMEMYEQGSFCSGD